MKIFGWVQSKLSGRRSGSKKPELSSDDCNWQEEISDLPGTFLAIGTLGNSNSRAAPHRITDPQKVPAASKDYSNLQPDSKDNQNYEIRINEENNEVSRAIIDDRLQLSNVVLPINGNDMFSENNNNDNNVIGKKSLSYLLKKMFVCKGGFPSSFRPSLRDPIPESRMENMLRAMLRKKIYPQGSPTTAKLSPKKYLRNKDMTSCINGYDAGDNGSKRF